MPAPTAESSIALQRCMDAACGAEYPIDRVLTVCPTCDGAGRGESLLDIIYDWPALRARGLARDFSHFLGPELAACGSGVWQFRELLPFFGSPADIVSIGEGKTILQKADALAGELGFKGKTPSESPNLFLQYEGLNPSGSFKDNGMAAGFTHARMVGAKIVACASTGNTSASLALYAAQAGMKAVVLIGEGKIALGKLSQALDFGATTLQINGDFDACLARLRQLAADPARGIYLLNSVNPFRLEGQKTIMYRVLGTPALRAGSGSAFGTTQKPGSESRGTQTPDWIIVPGGNLGNCSAFAKAFLELHALGLIDRIPRLAVINAAGASTLDRMVNRLGIRWHPSPHSSGSPPFSGSFDRAKVAAEYARMDAAGEKAHTIASAIEINRPVNLPKALRALHAMNGVVRSVDDDTILEHKALVGRFGYGCEPASAASVAGAAALLREGVIRPDETVVCILTGHQLKDPDATVGYHAGSRPRTHAHRPIRVPNDPAAILQAMGLG